MKTNIAVVLLLVSILLAIAGCIQTGNQEPTVVLSCVSNEPIIGKPVEFQVSGQDPDGDDLSFNLIWGDGTTGGLSVEIEETISHTYNRVGNFEVTLIGTDGQHTVEDSCSITIGISKEAKPSITFKGDWLYRMPCTMPCACRDEVIVEVEEAPGCIIGFGDGKYGKEGTENSHIYMKDGAYQVQAIVNNSVVASEVLIIEACCYVSPHLRPISFHQKDNKISFKMIGEDKDAECPSPINRPLCVECSAEAYHSKSVNGICRYRAEVRFNCHDKVIIFDTEPGADVDILLDLNNPVCEFGYQEGWGSVIVSAYAYDDDSDCSRMSFQEGKFYPNL